MRVNHGLGLNDIISIPKDNGSILPAEPLSFFPQGKSQKNSINVFRHRGM
jgi:hypothetical protein